MTNHNPLNEVLKHIKRELEIHDQLNDGVLEPGLSNRENCPGIIKLSIREAKALADNAWKIERFDAMQKDEQEGRIAVVPVEPTEEMKAKGKDATVTKAHASLIFKSMCRAAGPSRYFKQEGKKDE